MASFFNKRHILFKCLLHFQVVPLRVSLLHSLLIIQGSNKNCINDIETNYSIYIKYLLETFIYFAFSI